MCKILKAPLAYARGFFWSSLISKPVIDVTILSLLVCDNIITNTEGIMKKAITYLWLVKKFETCDEDHRS